MTGLELRCKPDKYIEETNTVVELKSIISPDPETFARQCYRLGYDRQADYYRLAFGDDCVTKFVCSRSDAPYECAVYTREDDALDLARDQNRADLHKLAKCIEDAYWLNPWEEREMITGLVGWAKYQDDWRPE